jgi:P27 family predicted phage terminase small subunit
MARRPRPTQLKILQGERPSRTNLDELPAHPGAPPPPEDLDDEVADAYRHIVELLEPTGVLTHLDGYALLAFAQTVIAHRRAAELEAAVGPLVRDRDNQPRVNPASRVRRDAGRDLLRWLAEFGMTPSARSSIARRFAGAVPASSPNSAASKYITGGGAS